MKVGSIATIKVMSEVLVVKITKVDDSIIDATIISRPFSTINHKLKYHSKIQFHKSIIIAHREKNTNVYHLRKN